MNISFVPVQPVELEDIGDGRLTACLLHTSQGQEPWPSQPIADSSNRTAANPSSASTTNSNARLIESPPDADADGGHRR